jgi:hypothetical protein
MRLISWTHRRGSEQYPTMEKNLFHCIQQWRKTSSVVSHKGGKPPPLYPLYPTTEENLFHCG